MSPSKFSSVRSRSTDQTFRAGTSQKLLFATAADHARSFELLASFVSSLLAGPQILFDRSGLGKVITDDRINIAQAQRVVRLDDAFGCLAALERANHQLQEHAALTDAKDAGRVLIDRDRQVGRLLSVQDSLDSDLAELYGVTTKAFNQAVKRNAKRFPADFMFQLTAEEADALRSQFVTSNKGRGGRRYAPYAFTEQGVAMLSSVLNSERAIEVNIAIMRAFVRLRELLSSHKDLARKLDELERKYDARFQIVFEAIRQLMTPPPAPKRLSYRLRGCG